VILCGSVNDLPQRSLLIRVAERMQPYAIIFFLLLVFCTYARPVTYLFHVKSEARNKPELWIVPQPLQLESGAPANGKIFCRFGYQFDSPWTDVSSERKQGTVDALIFSGGQGLMIVDASETTDPIANGQKPEDAKGVQAVKALFGYAFRSQVLNATPADLRWFATRQHMVSSSTLITLKILDAPHMQGGLYSFQTPRFRGFQIGSPSRDQSVTIEVYDPQDLKIRIVISSHAAPGEKFSQSDINQIISTLQPASLNCD
jgi:hypothetical protein